jgi:hypothetical protein
VVNGALNDKATNADELTRNAWFVLMIAIAVVIGVAGVRVNGEVFGAFIDDRNRYSLSRFQVASWTVVVLAAWLAVVIVRVAKDIDVDDALEVGIPGPVVAALGLAYGSFALSAGVKDRKRARTVDRDWRQQLEDEYARLQVQRATAAEALREATEQAATATDDTLRQSLQLMVDRQQRELQALTDRIDAVQAEIARDNQAEGLLARNASVTDASVGDLFRGEEVADADSVDFSKIQMLFITIVVVGSYALVLAEAMADGDLLAAGNAGVTFPDLSESLVGLLGISHAGYLAVKASNSTPPRPAAR